jgi:hypothetical protein
VVTTIEPLETGIRPRITRIIGMVRARTAYASQSSRLLAKLQSPQARVKSGVTAA